MVLWYTLKYPVYILFQVVFAMFSPVFVRKFGKRERVLCKLGLIDIFI